MQILSGQSAAREWGPREESDVVVARRARLRQLRLERAVKEAERVLDGHGPWDAELIRGADELADAIRGLVAQTVVPDLPGGDELAERRDCFLDGHRVTLLGRVVHALAEVWGVSVGPVELVEVDVVRPEPPERRVAGHED